MFIIDENDDLYACGNNDCGRLGLSHDFDISVFTSVGIKVIAVSCGLIHSAIIDKNNYVHTCGNNYYGQLGSNYKDMYGVFIPTNMKATAVSCGGYFTAIIDKHDLYICGENNGCIPDLCSEDIFSFEKVDIRPKLPEMKRFKTTKSARNV